jgi:hypothetical protein
VNLRPAWLLVAALLAVIAGIAAGAWLYAMVAGG